MMAVGTHYGSFFKLKHLRTGNKIHTCKIHVHAKPSAAAAMTSSGIIQDYHSTRLIKSKDVKAEPFLTESSQLQDQHKQEWESKTVSLQKERPFQRSSADSS